MEGPVKADWLPHRYAGVSQSWHRCGASVISFAAKALVFDTKLEAFSSKSKQSLVGIAAAWFG
jgi:hypothetical protein